MRYRILLTGRDKVVKDDFFIHLEKRFELQTTSMRLDDIISHLRYYKPNALVICLRNESRDDVGGLIAAKSRLAKNNIPVIIIGGEEDCQEFETSTSKMSALIITRPLPLRTIGESIVGFIDKWQSEHEEEEQAEEIYKDTVQQEGKGTDQAEKDAQKDIKPVEKKTVLVVDDDPMMLKLIKEQLKDIYSVATAINSNIAFKFLENKGADLILLDYEMPGENGAQVLEKLRGNENTAHLPVIFLTGINDKDKIRKVLELKPQGYLLKPIDREKLRSIIEMNI